MCLAPAFIMAFITQQLYPSSHKEPLQFLCYIFPDITLPINCFDSIFKSFIFTWKFHQRKPNEDIIL